MERFKMAAQTRTVLFDKTGTLTMATLRVSCAVIADDWSDTVGRRIAWWTAIGELERQVTHPVAAAVVHESERQVSVIGHSYNLVLEPAPIVSAVDYVPGRGIQGLVALPGSKPVHVAVGSLAFMNSISVTADLSAVPEQARSTIASTLVVSIDHTYAGILVCEDVIRPTAKAAVAALKKRGINVGLLTGDTFSSASLIAKAVGIPVERIYADRLPDEKAHVVRELRRLGPVTFVGDNLNDIPAFATSSFSVAVVSDSTHSPCGPGSVDALLSAVLQPGKTEYDGLEKIPSAAASDTLDLTRLPYLIDLAMQAVTRVRLNLMWCALYNVTSLLLSSGALEFVHPRLLMPP
jgi:cation transport ATPase